jgi:GT2 family glycosyltransferase
LAASAPVPVEIARVPADPPVVGTAKKDDVIPIRGEFVALLNNDVIVTAAWLDRLIALAASAPNIGMVAPMSNHGPQSLRVDNVSYAIDEWDSANDTSTPSTNGPVRMPRSGLLPLIDRVNRFAAEWREKHANDKQEHEVLGGGCVLVRREVLRKLGLFPTRTPLGTFDTTALAQRVQQAGFRLAACGDLFVHSFGSRG